VIANEAETVAFVRNVFADAQLGTSARNKTISDASPFGETGRCNVIHVLVRMLLEGGYRHFHGNKPK
jgi:hypothetical protein